MTCETVKQQLPLLLYGELTFEAENEVEQHLEACAGCHDDLRRLQAMHSALDEAELAVPPSLLAGCRRDLHAAVAAAPARPAGFWAKVRPLFPGAGHPGLRMVLRPAGALALVASGFFVARFWQAPPASVSPDPTPGGLIATRVKQIEPDPTGTVRIVIEETRQRQISGQRDEQQIRNLLLAAAQDPLDAGLRVESVDLLKEECDAKEVRDALLQSLLSDTNVGVRMKALEGLKPFASEASVRRALLQALVRDENPRIRTQAIDLLVPSRQRDLVGALQELMLRENDEHIRSRTQRLLRDLNASVETF